MLFHCLGSLEEQSMTTFIIIVFLQLLVCQRDFIDFENFLRNISFVFFVGCMHLIGFVVLYFTAFDDISLSVTHLWNLWNIEQL